MPIERIKLTPDYSVSRIIKGGWHLAGGHGKINRDIAIDDMKKFVMAGITTFDCADIYTGVEELIGEFMVKYRDQFHSGELPEVQIHTKYVPDLNTLKDITLKDTEKIIDRSLSRLNVERLDLVQFHWWDYSVPRYIEVANHLKDLKEKGKIRYIGLTNFDGKRVREIAKSGVPIISNQVQYSLLDHRVEDDLNSKMKKFNIQYLCYGVLAGGFLTNSYLNQKEPVPPFENRSLTKYRLIIDEYGGYSLYQKALSAINLIANKHNVGIAEIAMKYILQKKYVASIIIGSRDSKHLSNLDRLDNFELDNSDLELLRQINKSGLGPSGRFYALEREKEGKHASIMKYNLNSEK